MKKHLWRTLEKSINKALASRKVYKKSNRWDEKVKINTRLKKWNSFTNCLESPLLRQSERTNHLQLKFKSENKNARLVGCVVIPMPPTQNTVHLKEREWQIACMDRYYAGVEAKCWMPKFGQVYIRREGAKCAKRGKMKSKLEWLRKCERMSLRMKLCSDLSILKMCEKSST